MGKQSALSGVGLIGNECENQIFAIKNYAYFNANGICNFNIRCMLLQPELAIKIKRTNDLPNDNISKLSLLFTTKKARAIN